MPSPLVHSVHFYDHDAALISRLHNVVQSSLDGGGSVLIVASEGHRLQLQSALKQSGKSVPDGRLQMFDARETLSKFMVGDRPSDSRFAETVGALLGNARETTRNPRRSVTVFGEMVAVLWEEGNKTGALELERLWNDTLHQRNFHLHCAYPRWILQDKSDNLMIKAICDEHSSVLGHSNRLRPSVAHSGIEKRVNSLSLCPNPVH